MVLKFVDSGVVSILLQYLFGWPLTSI